MVENPLDGKRHLLGSIVSMRWLRCIETHRETIAHVGESPIHFEKTVMWSKTYIDTMYCDMLIDRNKLTLQTVKMTSL